MTAHTQADLDVARGIVGNLADEVVVTAIAEALAEARRTAADEQLSGAWKRGQANGIREALEAVNRHDHGVAGIEWLAVQKDINALLYASDAQHDASAPPPSAPEPRDTCTRTPDCYCPVCRPRDVVSPSAPEPRVMATAGADDPWPLRDVLAKLADAADHLLRKHQCDDHGHEEVAQARDAARKWLRDRLHEMARTEHEARMAGLGNDERERRERIATAMAPGLLAGDIRVPEGVDPDAFVARAAVRVTDALIAELDRRAEQAPPSAKPAPEPQCTGYAASWCPRCGDCTCERSAHDERIDSPDCPLHDALSKHAEAEVPVMDDTLAAAEAAGYARCQADVVAFLRSDSVPDSLHRYAVAKCIEKGESVGAAARAAKDGAP